MTGATNAGEAAVQARSLLAALLTRRVGRPGRPHKRRHGGYLGGRPVHAGDYSAPLRALLCRLYPGGRIQCLRATVLLCRLLRAAQGLNDFLVRHGDGARIRRPASCLRVGCHQPGDGAVHRAGFRSGILAAPPHREEREGAAAGLIRETGYAIHAHPGSKRTHLWGIELSGRTCCTNGLCDACRACASSCSTCADLSRY